METRKLYYEDSHLTQFEATVLACGSGENGHWVELDQTAFFPGGGGQACDLGRLGQARVTDMKEEGERVLHLCDRPLAVGTQVEGRIDWERRFDLMQQHSGEHILSGLLHAATGCHNVGFHMGADTVTIDFDRELDEETIRKAEKSANQAVWENLPLEIFTPSPEALPGVVYRTKRALPWPVRIVRIPGYDSCACCGVHVKATGEIGPIQILSWMKFRSGVRLEILCGRRALDYLSRSHRQNQLVSREFSAPIFETGAAAQEMNQRLAQAKFQQGKLERQIFGLLAEQAKNAGNTLMFWEDLPSASLRILAEQVGAVCGGTAALFSGSDETGYRYCLMDPAQELGTLGKAMDQALAGRGGGKPPFRQGSVQARADRIRDFFAGQGWVTEK